MSEPKMKIPFEQMAFYYETAITDAVNKLFSEESGLGWTREEFDKIFYLEVVQSALQGSERVLH